VIILDTTILTYASGGEHHLRPACRELIDLVRDGAVSASTTIEVIQEFAHVRARRHGRVEAATRSRELLVSLAPLTQTDTADHLEGLRIFEQTEQLGSFDCLLAALARRRGWALASADRAFSSVEGLRHLNPAAEGFADAVHGAG
jgi:predicted nucleic acid-binding protein